MSIRKTKRKKLNVPALTPERNPEEIASDTLFQISHFQAQADTNLEGEFNKLTNNAHTEQRQTSKAQHSKRTQRSFTQAVRGNFIGRQILMFPQGRQKQTSLNPKTKIRCNIASQNEVFEISRSHKIDRGSKRKVKNQLLNSLQSDSVFVCRRDVKRNSKKQRRSERIITQSSLLDQTQSEIQNRSQYPHIYGSIIEREKVKVRAFSDNSKNKTNSGISTVGNLGVSNSQAQTLYDGSFGKRNEIKKYIKKTRPDREVKVSTLKFKMFLGEGEDLQQKRNKNKKKTYIATEQAGFRNLDFQQSGRSISDAFRNRKGSKINVNSSMKYLKTFRTKIQKL